MKFIGQYIQSLIARFRNDVYLDNVQSGSVNSGDHLGVDAYGKIVKTTGGGGSNIKKVDDYSPPNSVADFEGKDFYLSNTPNNNALYQRLFVINNEQDGIF